MRCCQTIFYIGQKLLLEGRHREKMFSVAQQKKCRNISVFEMNENKNKKETVSQE